MWRYLRFLNIHPLFRGFWKWHVPSSWVFDSPVKWQWHLETNEFKASKLRSHLENNAPVKEVRVVFVCSWKRMKIQCLLRKQFYGVHVHSSHRSKPLAVGFPAWLVLSHKQHSEIPDFFDCFQQWLWPKSGTKVQRASCACITFILVLTWRREHGHKCTGKISSRDFFLKDNCARFPSC